MCLTGFHTLHTCTLHCTVHYITPGCHFTLCWVCLFRLSLQILHDHRKSSKMWNSHMIKHLLFMTTLIAHPLSHCPLLFTRCHGRGRGPRRRSFAGQRSTWRPWSPPPPPRRSLNDFSCFWNFHLYNKNVLHFSSRVRDGVSLSLHLIITDTPISQTSLDGCHIDPHAVPSPEGCPVADTSPAT